MSNRFFPLILLVFTAPTLQAADPALGGACPVSLYESGKVVLGKQEYSTTYDRQTYYFPSARQLAQFRANPMTYAPILNGDCVVSWANMHVRMPGKLEFAFKHNNRMYLFPDKGELDIFRSDPKKYERADSPFVTYCPVSLLDQRRLIQNRANYESRYDGLRYLFPSAILKARFDANPAKYAPALSGHCVVNYQDGKSIARGKMQHGVFYNGRSFLLSNAEARAKFMQNPSRYALADLANEGNCVVSAKESRAQRAGSQIYQSVYHGLLYRFPGSRQRQMFNENPQQYALFSPLEVPKEKANNSTKPLPLIDLGKATPEKVETPKRVIPTGMITIEGQTACAGCDYGKRPITKPDNLGLAVVAKDVVYILDGAKQLYPKIYENRFEELQVKVQGKVKRQDGKFIWLELRSLAEIQ